MLSIVSLDRGETFRRALFEIGTLRSLISKSVNVMALTVTATNHTVSAVTYHLAMDDPMIIETGQTSNTYIIQPSQTINEISVALADELILTRTNMPKTVIFCRALRECADMFTAIIK